jgi:hypothetical protein
MAKRKQKPPGQCIFCESTGVTKEHIWSDWLGELIPRRESHDQGTAAFDFDRRTKEFRLQQPMSFEKKRGCLSQRKVRKVCLNCNNGWMSRAVDTAKPVVEKLTRGIRCTCSMYDFANLIPWLAITTITQEFISTPDAIYIPIKDRKTVMDTKFPPLDWTIWIGYYGGQAWNVMGHTHYTAKLKDHEWAKVTDCYIQMGTFSVRNLFVHAVTATLPGVVAEYRQFVRDANWNLFQIWPPKSGRMSWPRFPILDGELKEIVTGFGRERLGLAVDFNPRHQHRV